MVDNHYIRSMSASAQILCTEYREQVLYLPRAIDCLIKCRICSYEDRLAIHEAMLEYTN